VPQAEIRLRIAERRDAQCLSALGTQVFLETYATSGIRLTLAREVDSQFSVSATLARLNERACRTVLAEHAGHLVGFAEVVLGAAHALVAAQSAAELTRLYVQSPFPRQGVGRSLLGQAEALASAEAASTLWLTVWVSNQRALAFYESQRYKPLGSTAYTFGGESFENRLFAKALRAES